MAMTNSENLQKVLQYIIFIANKNESSKNNQLKKGSHGPENELESIIDMRILDMLRLLEEYMPSSKL